jgi:hypothetical protein
MTFCFPPFQHQIRQVEGKSQIYDVIRKKYVQLTPEEWVRQHLIHWLITEKKLPKTSISVEKQITVQQQSRRYDVVVYDDKGDVLLLCECKSPDIQLTESTIQQLAHYQSMIQAKYLLITNGLVMVGSYT